MPIASRVSMWSGARTPTAKDYVQDGLIAMWDGIENAGWGTHDSAATTWKDLVGNRGWTLGTSTSYEWTANSFDAKDQFAATQEFIPANSDSTVEFCVEIDKSLQEPGTNVAFIILGRSVTSSLPYYGLFFRLQYSSLMACRSFFASGFMDFRGVAASFSFPRYEQAGWPAFFNGVSRNATSNNTFDYNATTRGTVARIGGDLTHASPLKVYSIRLYNRRLATDEIAHNYAIDKERFGLT